MKRYLFFFAGLLAFVLYVPVSGQSAKTVLPSAATGISGVSASCDLFVSVIQAPPVFSSREEITRLIEFSRKARIKILFIQVYRANQAWFSSKTADTTLYNKCVRRIGEDPLALLIKQAQAAGIEVHAWLNMLSLSNNKDAKILKKYGPEILTRNLKAKKNIEDYQIDEQYFLEPGDLRVRRELAKMVEDLLRAYPALDGIQFDYIRYPDKDPAYGYTKMNIRRFKKATGLKKIEEGSRVWNDWKRSQVTAFLDMLVKKTRAIRPGIRISTTGCMSYARSYHEAYQDWASWLDSKLVDFVTMMSYTEDTALFKKYITEAGNQTSNFGKVNIGIGAYKVLRLPKAFADQFRLCNESGGGDCVVFHYGSLIESPGLQETLIKTNGGQSK